MTYFSCIRLYDGLFGWYQLYEIGDCAVSQTVCYSDDGVSHVALSAMGHSENTLDSINATAVVQFELCGSAVQIVNVDGRVPRHEQKPHAGRVRLVYLEHEVAHFDYKGHRYSVVPVESMCPEHEHDSVGVVRCTDKRGQSSCLIVGKTGADKPQE